MSFNKIDVTEIKGFLLGNAENSDAGTGCTVIICPKGAVAGVDVRGGAPATRETDLLRSENTVECIHAVVLSGGSAFGLEAGSGVMQFLEKNNIGLPMGNVYVPIVTQASLFDLGVGSSEVRPDLEMGIEACLAAYQGDFSNGNHGAGTGASVGKCYGMDRAMKTGLGSFACSDGDLQVGAISAVNAVGDVYNGYNNIVAGLLDKNGKHIEGTIHCIKSDVTCKQDFNTDKKTEFKECENNEFESEKDQKEDENRTESYNIKSSEDDKENNKDEKKLKEMGYDISFNTTISCLITNAALTKSQANKLASILHDGYARAIKPVHGTMDGDTIFVMSTNEIPVNFDAFAALATDIMQYAVIDGAVSAEDAYGLLSAHSVQ